jgi:hypothetical protein
MQVEVCLNKSEARLKEPEDRLPWLEALRRLPEARGRAFIFLRMVCFTGRSTEIAEMREIQG